MKSWSMELGDVLLQSLCIVSGSSDSENKEGVEQNKRAISQAPKSYKSETSDHSKWSLLDHHLG